MAQTLNPPPSIWSFRLDADPTTGQSGADSVAVLDRPVLDTWSALRRYLLVGGTDRALAASLPITVADAEPVRAALAEDSLRVVAEILAATVANPSRPEPLLLALALAAAADDDLTRRAALTALPRVARSGYELFLFATFVQGLRGWGRGLRRAVGAWFNDRTQSDLVEDMLATPDHAGWRHADLLRLGHPKAPTLTHDAIYRWAVTGVAPNPAPVDPASPRSGESLARLVAATELAETTDAAAAAGLVSIHRLPLASIPERLRRDPVVREALLPHLRKSELLSALPELASTGCLEPGAFAHRLVCDRLSEPSAAGPDRLTPLAVVAALRSYETGHAADARWVVDEGVLTALGHAFDRSCQQSLTDDLPTVTLRIPASIAQRSGQVGELSAIDVAATLAVVLSRSGLNARIEVFGSATLPLRLPSGAGIDETVATIGHLAARTELRSDEEGDITIAVTLIGGRQRVVRLGGPVRSAGTGFGPDPDEDGIAVHGIDANLVGTILGLLSLPG